MNRARLSGTYRVFSVLLSLYVVFLTLTSCPDKDIRACNEGACTNSMNTAGNHPELPDCCSPFCTCSCCSLPFETANVQIVSSVYSFQEKISFYFQPIQESHFAYSIWEPPKA